MISLEMKNHNMISSREAAITSSGKNDQYEYLTSEEILPSGQKIMIQHASFTYSNLYWRTC